MNFNISQKKKSQIFTKYSTLQLMMETSWSKGDYVSFAEEGYIKNVIAFRAINMIATAAASVPFTLCQLIDQGKSQLKIHTLLKLLYSPNPITSKSEFIKGILIYRLISGKVDKLTGRSAVLHLKIQLLNDRYGLSPIEAAAYSIDQHNQAGA